MTQENQRLRDSLKRAETIIVNALTHQPEGSEQCREHLLKACQEAVRSLRRATGRPVDCPVSNVAAMYKALVSIKDEAETGYEYREYPIAGAPGEYGTCRVVDADYLIDECNAALASKPRACDIMAEDDLINVATNGIVASIESRPELDIDGARTLIEVAVASAIKCAYDTQLVIKKEEEQAAKSEAAPETPPPLDVCPKCGADAAILVHPAFDGGAYVRCNKCRYSDQILTWAPTDAKAAVKWNNQKREAKS